MKVSVATGNHCVGLTFMSKLEGVIQRLGDVREVWAKGKFCNYVRKIHLCRAGQLSLLPNKEI